MADKKISQLSAASTPLAGTEVLPIVQSSATVKVATNDLTVKNIRSNATTGILQVAGPAAAATRTMTVPDANFTAARTDAANSFTGNQTLSDGNLVVGTAGKGVDFTANGGTVLGQYIVTTYTPTVTTTSGTITTYTASGNYTRIGNRILLSIQVTVTDNGTASGAMDITLPVTAAGSSAVTGQNASINKMIGGNIGLGNSSLRITLFDGTYPAGTGHTLRLSGHYAV